MLFSATRFLAALVARKSLKYLLRVVVFLLLRDFLHTAAVCVGPLVIRLPCFLSFIHTSTSYCVWQDFSSGCNHLGSYTGADDRKDGELQGKAAVAFAFELYQTRRVSSCSASDDEHGDAIDAVDVHEGYKYAW